MIANEILAIRPDWSDAPRMEYAWNTTVKRGLTGAEKRSGLLSAPRRALEYTAQARSGLEAEMLKKRMYASFGQIFGVPLWTDATMLTASCNAGATALTVKDADYRSFEAGKMAIIVSGSEYEVVTLSGVGSTSLTLSSGTVYGWSAGAMICPLFQGRVDSTTITIKGETDRDGSFSIRLLEEYEERLSVPTSDVSDYPTYNELMVLDTAHNWADSFSQSLDMDIESFSAISGITKYLAAATEPRQTITLSALTFTRQKARQVLDFYLSRKGRLLPFWVPSPASDLILSAGFAATDTTLSISGSDAAIFFAHDFATAGKHLWFRFPDGSAAAREVSAVDASAGTITLTEAIGTAVDHYGVVTVSLLYPARFSKDILAVDYNSLDVAETTLEIITLPTYEVE